MSVKSIIVIKVLVLFVTLSFLTGCWDYSPVETQFNITGITVDQSKTNLKWVDVSVIAVNFPKTKIALSGEGATISDAINQIQNSTSKTVVLSHVQVILFSEVIAKKGIPHLLDLFFRDMEMRKDATYAVVKGQAKDLFNQKKVKNKITGRTYPYLIKSTDTEFSPTIYQSHYLALKIVENHKHFVLPVLKLNKTKKVVKFVGLSLLKNGKQVGVLSKSQSNAYLIMQRELNRMYETIRIKPDHHRAAKTMTMRLKMARPNIQVSYRNNKYTFVYNVRFKDEILEINPWDVKPIGNQEVKTIETKIEKQLEKQCKNMVHKLQNKYEFDPLWLSEYARVTNPRAFRNRNWDRQFCEATFIFKFDVKLERFGQLF